MTRKNSAVFLISILISLGSVQPGFSLEIRDVDLHLRVSFLTRAEKPFFIHDQLLFTYHENRFIRSAGIAFRHENFRTIHLFHRNEQGVFFFLFTPGPDMQRIEYRLIIDGVWMRDPANPSVATSSGGVSFSFVDIPPAVKVTQPRSPETDQRGIVTFHYEGAPGRRVSVSGTFNGWDPFIHPMEEHPRHPGYYTISMRVPPGTHYYHFVQEGVKIPDPKNPDQVYTPAGLRVSRLQVR